VAQGNSSRYIVISKSIRDKAGIEPGDQVDLELEAAEGQTEAPDELKDVFGKNLRQV
jgi:bifunctional DNA-binding transcriptional regulator/antitoxin component of YhaV-PrlF toxin-antitoxin module